jgi:hypothetical protein
VDVQIGEVTTELVVNESVGSLGPEEVKRLLKLMMDHLREQQSRAGQQERDTAVRDRAFHPGR